MKFKPKIKTKWRNDVTIKIKTLLEVTENPKGCFSNKEKIINVELDNKYSIISTSFEYNKKGKKELIDFIKERMYLK